MKNNLFEKFVNEKVENLDAIRGGEINGGKTGLKAGATLRTNSEGCQQADVRANDKQSDVGEPSCPEASDSLVTVAFSGGPSMGGDYSSVSFSSPSFLSTN
jgi:hypothetical protein